MQLTVESSIPSTRRCLKCLWNCSVSFPSPEVYLQLEIRMALVLLAYSIKPNALNTKVNKGRKEENEIWPKREAICAKDLCGEDWLVCDSLIRLAHCSGEKHRAKQVWAFSKAVLNLNLSLLFLLCSPATQALTMSGLGSTWGSCRVM